ncbi:MAG: LPXTG cell wall anchor domain-containing protein, partial [Roseburia inulinivorans]
VTPQPTETPQPTVTPQPTETPQPTVTPQPTAVQDTSPQTGDTTPLMLWVVLLVISAMGLAGCLWVRFRKKHFKN